MCRWDDDSPRGPWCSARFQWWWRLCCSGPSEWAYSSLASESAKRGSYLKRRLKRRAIGCIIERLSAREVFRVFQSWECDEHQSWLHFVWENLPGGRPFRREKSQVQDLRRGAGGAG